MKICSWHLCDKELTGKRTKFCSIQCKNKVGATLARRNNKTKLVELLGSKCMDCGYEGPPFMFDFDHRDPTTKNFGIASKGHTKKFDLLVEEVEKCDLVCSNCHRKRTHIQRCGYCEWCIKNI